MNCGYFARKGLKVRTEAEWRLTHDSHVEATGTPYRTERQAENPNPSVGWLICPCGARLLGMKYGEQREQKEPDKNPV